MKAVRFLKPIFLSLYDHFQTLFVIVTTQEKFALFQDLDLI